MCGVQYYSWPQSLRRPWTIYQGTIEYNSIWPAIAALYCRRAKTALGWDDADDTHALQNDDIETITDKEPAQGRGWSRLVYQASGESMDSTGFEAVSRGVSFQVQPESKRGWVAKKLLYHGIRE